MYIKHACMHAHIIIISLSGWKSVVSEVDRENAMESFYFSNVYIITRLFETFTNAVCRQHAYTYVCM